MRKGTKVGEHISCLGNSKYLDLSGSSMCGYMGILGSVFVFVTDEAEEMGKG